MERKIRMEGVTELRFKKGLRKEREGRKWRLKTTAAMEGDDGKI